MMHVTNIHKLEKFSQMTAATKVVHFYSIRKNHERLERSSTTPFLRPELIGGSF